MSQITKIIIFTTITISFTFAYELTCTYNHINRDHSVSNSEEGKDFFWSSLGHVYTCDGKITLDETESDQNQELTKISKITSEHRRPKSDRHVHGLIIANQRLLETFPREVADTFSNLKAIDLEGCGLKHISSSDLEGFTDLVQISLDANYLVELPHDLFINNPRLTRIDLEGNNLVHIGHDIFKHLYELRIVYMRYNTCTSDNSIAISKEDVKILQWELSVECPPTFKQLQSALIESDDYMKVINRVAEESVDKRASILMDEIKKLEREILSLKLGDVGK